MIRMHTQQIQNQNHQATPDGRTPFFADLQPSHTGLSKMAAGNSAMHESKGAIQVKEFRQELSPEESEREDQAPAANRFTLGQ